MKEALLIAGVVGLFAAAAFFALRQSGRRAKELEAFARARGWTYARTDTVGLKRMIEGVFPDQTFSLENVMVVESDGARLYLFECGYRSKARTDASFAVGGLLETSSVPSGASVVEVFPRVPLEEKLESDIVDLGDAQFRERFLAASKDPASARRLLPPRLRKVLVEHAGRSSWMPLRLNLGRGRIVLLAGPNQGDEIWAGLRGLLQNLEHALR